jgi:hypothetical protein
MMGIKIDGPVYAYGDNMSMLKNSSLPESILKKKCNSICYHAIHDESVATGELGITNPAELLTEFVPGGAATRGSHVIYFSFQMFGRNRSEAMVGSCIITVV